MRRDDGAIVGSSPPPEREWLPEGALLVLSALAVTLLFGVSSLDITAARWFYRPTGTDHWPLAAQDPWPLLYRASPWVTASLVIAGLAMLAAGTLLRRRPWRRHAVFVLLSVVLGPGLIGNVLLKDHWNHPRPREIVEFGGALHYVSTPLPGREGGASFPCGHCTVGFLYGIGWWIWKRRRAQALTSLSAGLLAGGLLGVGRMAAGAHFLSDIFWSALLAAGVSHILYYHVLRLPRDEAPNASPLAARRPESPWLRASTVAAVLGAAGVLVALFATPHGTPLDTVVPLASLPQAPRVLEVQARKGSIEILLVDAPASQVTIRGELHGFGLPLSRLGAHVEFIPDPVPRIVFRIEQRGLFTDLDGFASLRVPAAGLEQLVVRLRQGDIRVTDATRAGVVTQGTLRLDLHTGAGHIQSPGRR
jgi:membrane-associated PAP2 superfamily phosphatase